MVFWFFKKSEDPQKAENPNPSSDRAKSPQAGNRSIEKSTKSDRKRNKLSTSRSNEKVDKSTRMAQNDADADNGTSPDTGDDPMAPTAFVPVNVTVRPAVTRMHTRNVVQEEREEPTQMDAAGTPPGKKKSDKKKKTGDFFRKLTDRKKTSERKRNNPPSRDVTTANTTDDSSRVRQLEEEQEKLRNEVSCLKTQVVELQVQFANLHAQFVERRSMPISITPNREFTQQLSPPLLEAEKLLPEIYNSSPTHQTGVLTTLPSKPNVVETSIFTPNAIVLQPQSKPLVVPAMVKNQVAPLPPLAKTPPTKFRAPSPSAPKPVAQPVPSTPQIEVQKAAGGAPPAVKYVIKDHRMLNGKLVPYYVPELPPKPNNPANATGQTASSPNIQARASPPVGSAPGSPNPHGKS